MPPLSEAYAEPLPDAPSIWDAFQSNVDAEPDALGVVCTHQPAGLFGVNDIPLEDGQQQAPYLRWPLRSLHERIEHLAATWRSLGVREGSMFVTFVPNGIEYVLAAYAAIKLGCVYMPINPRNLVNAAEVTHMLKTGLSIQNGERPVVMAGNSELAKAVDDLHVLADAVKIILTEDKPANDWIPFSSLMGPCRPNITNGEHVPSKANGVRASSSSQGGTIFFTSGTTSMPKGMFHTYMNNMARTFIRRSQPLGKGGFGPGARLCCALPNNHAMGWICLTAALSTRSALVVPGPAFDPVAMLDTLYRERVTHIMLVPTMVHALTTVKASNPSLADRPLRDLENVMLGGSQLTVDTMRMIIEDFGAQGAENFYGCTEGHLTSSSWTPDPTKIAEGQDVSVGGPIKGYAAKVVDPETGRTVVRGEFGELHCSGYSITGPYIGGAGKDNWYTDENGVLWYKSGDQVRMDGSGRLYVVGRYKDMIIRGGENISPNAIEALLAQNPLLGPLLPQIVGAKDPIAGEVPVAVIRGSVTPDIRDAIQRDVISHMGPLYVPEDVISTEDLGIADYPRTTSGKIQKTKVAALVNKYLAEPVPSLANGHQSNGNGQSSDQLADQIKTIWAKAVGLDPSRIRMDAAVSEFADSITIMRVRDRIKKQTGKALPLAALTDAGSIQKQVELLRSMDSTSTTKTPSPQSRPARQGGPGPEDMAHLAENPELFGPTRDLVVDAISRYGLGWEDVDDVIPAYDFNNVMSRTRLHDSWRWEFAMLPKERVGKVDLRKALEAVISNNRLLASVFVWDSSILQSEVALHVVMKRTDAFFDLIIGDGGELEAQADLKDLAIKYRDPAYVAYPGPLFRVRLFSIKQTGDVALLISTNHSVIDASMMQLFQDDLDKALVHAARSKDVSAILDQLPVHVDYKPWADCFYTLRTSIEARAATKWHVRRLSKLAEHVQTGALFPSRPKGPCTSEAFELNVSFEVPDIHALRREYPRISPTVVVKSAVALMNVHRTGHTHAVFGNLEAARKYFPFLPKSVIEQPEVGRHFEATDVSGPTYQMVFNDVEIRKDETVVQFWERMQAEQAMLTKHASAPLKEIMAGLDELSPGGRELLPRIIDTQHFNWVPGLGTTGTDAFQNFRVLHAVNRPRTGLSMLAGLGGEEGQTVFVNVYGDGEAITAEEAAQVGGQLTAITQWLTRRENWGSQVGGFEACFTAPLPSS